MITSDDVVAALDQARCEQGALDDTGSTEQPARLRMRDLFAVAKAHRDLPCDEVETLLEHPGHQTRLAAVCILDFKARRARSRAERRPLYELYLRRHDRIDTWDMVDRAAPWVVGGYLTGHDLAPLVELAASSAPLERRTAMTAPLYFVKAGTDADLMGAFDIADLLVNDPTPVVHNAVGIFIKHAGRGHPARQRAFLDEHAATMPRPGLRLALLQLQPDERRRYLALRRT